MLAEKFILLLEALAKSSGNTYPDGSTRWSARLRTFRRGCLAPGEAGTRDRRHAPPSLSLQPTYLRRQPLVVTP
jgi:hypothetical protein